MSSTWQVVRVEDVCSNERAALSTGPFGSAISSKHFLESGVPVIRGGNLSQDVGTRLSHDDLVYVSTEKAKEFARSIARRGDIVFTCWGTIDQVGLIDETSLFEEYVISNKQMKMTPNPEIADSQFLYYQFSGPRIRNWIISNGIGSSVPGFNLGQLRRLEINLPPLTEQKSIAHILGAFDDKIELNRKTIGTLEAMARAIFNSWFVSFDPVRAKTEGRATGLPDGVSNLFPDSFEDADFGEIPAGWVICPISECVDGFYDGPHATPREASFGPIFLGIKNLTGTKIDLTEVRHIGEEDWPQWTRRVEPRPGDIVFSYEAALGLFAIIPEGVRCCLGRRLALIRPSEYGGTPHFWLHQFVSERFQRLIDERAIHGATVNRTPLTEFPSYPVLAPPISLRAAFEEFASPIWRRIHYYQEQTRLLAETRDVLLPRLVSGELRVPEAEAILATASL